MILKRIFKIISDFFIGKKIHPKSLIKKVIDVPELYLNGEYFYVRGWSNYPIWEKKMIRHFGDNAYPYLKEIWKSLLARNIQVRPEYSPDTSNYRIINNISYKKRNDDSANTNKSDNKNRNLENEYDQICIKLNDYPPDWDLRRKKVLERDNYTCTECGWPKGFKRKSRELHIHHIISLSKGGDNSLDNLITLCHVCHKKVDNSHRLVRNNHRKIRKNIK